VSDARTRAARTSFEQVQAILHRDWDPIGCGVPLDEYDSYAWPVVKLLMAKAPREDLEQYLREAAAGMMSPVPEKRLRDVVDRLLDLKASPAS
jgi:hypothetical protein